jgi:AraC-like DNA-binding protein
MAINVLRESSHRQLSIAALAKAVNLSPARLRQLFKRDTGQSPGQYLKEFRMQSAEHLLQTSFLSIKEVAHLSGLSDVSHFVRAFKKRHSVTPSEFRFRAQRSAQRAAYTKGR